VPLVKRGGEFGEMLGGFVGHDLGFGMNAVLQRVGAAGRDLF
jgi:hypothetical protein